MIVSTWSDDWNPTQASLCGHYEVVQLLLESGALCERDTFQGERALYNALNDRIRSLLLQYDYSKTRDPLQPLAGHVSSLLTRETPKTTDIAITTDGRTFELHKFILSARSPYFAKKLNNNPSIAQWRIPPAIPRASLDIAIRALYFREVSLDFHDDSEDRAILDGIHKLAKHLEIENLLDLLLETDRRIQRQKRTDETVRGRGQLRDWFERNVVAHRFQVSTEQVDNVKWDRQNGIFADVLLAAEDDDGRDDADLAARREGGREVQGPLNGIPIGPHSPGSRAASRGPRPRYSTMYPAHRAMLLRSEYFSAMFSSPFREAQPSEHLPVVHVDCSPEVLEIVLRYLYTEEANFGLDVAVDVLFVADELFIEKLKVKAAVTISTLGNGTASIVESNKPRGETDMDDLIDVYEVIRAGWDTRVTRLEEFGARYIAYRLERFIDEPDFKSLVKESASRIKRREATDTVELIDDIRYYLSERFRLRFEDSGFDEILEGQEEADHAVMNGHAEKTDLASQDVYAVSAESLGAPDEGIAGAGVIRTLDGEEAGDEFAQDALNYQILLGKIDHLLEHLHLDA